MPVVYIPAMLRDLANGEPSVEVEGTTVRQVIDNLEQVCPGIRERLVDQDRLRSNISVAIDDEITPLGLRGRVSPSSEVHFIVAIKGGCRACHLLLYRGG